MSYGARSGLLEAELREIELTLTNAMRQFDASNRGRGAPEPLESKHHVCSVLDVAMILFDHAVQIF
jgi:hypothetical protein